jgi:hypothetical protein
MGAGSRILAGLNPSYSPRALSPCLPRWSIGAYRPLDLQGQLAARSRAAVRRLLQR